LVRFGERRDYWHSDSSVLMLQFYCKPVANPPLTPLVFVGETLPMAFPNVPYSQDISGQVSGNVGPITFTLISALGTDIWTVSPQGVINGTPGLAFRITASGLLRITNAGSLRIT